MIIKFKFYTGKAVFRLIDQISAQAHKGNKNGQVKPEKFEIIKNIDKPYVFEDMMKINQK